MADAIGSNADLEDTMGEAKHPNLLSHRSPPSLKGGGRAALFYPRRYPPLYFHARPIHAWKRANGKSECLTLSKV